MCSSLTDSAYTIKVAETFARRVQAFKKVHIGDLVVFDMGKKPLLVVDIYSNSNTSAVIIIMDLSSHRTFHMTSIYHDILKHITSSQFENIQNEIDRNM